MTKLKDLKLTPPKILLWGPAGVGKTVLALTLGSRGVIIDLENGLRSGLSVKDSFTSQRGEVDVRQSLESSAKKAIGFALANSFITGIADETLAKRLLDKALIIDSFTALAEFSMRDVLAANGTLGGLPQIQHWGLSYNRIENFLMTLRSLPIPVVMIAHQQLHEENGVVVKDIAIPGVKLAPKVTNPFDEIWYMKSVRQPTGETKYLLQTKSSILVPNVKSRANLPDDLDTSIGMIEILRKCRFEFPSATPPTMPVQGEKG